MTKLTLSILVFLFLSLNLHAQDTSVYGENPERLFDFWVGKWQVSWIDNEGNPGLGENEIVWLIDDKVLQENFKISEGKNKGYKGTSISVYQKRLDLWKQSWADNNGGYITLKGEVDSDKRIFITEPINRNGKMIIQRMVFHSIKENSLTWDWEASEDGGETWTLQWRIFYERI